MSQDKKPLVGTFKIGGKLYTVASSGEARLEEAHFTTPTQIVCKWCGSSNIMKYGIRDGIQEYICSKCHRKFTNVDNPYKMRSTSKAIADSLDSYYNGESFADIADKRLKEGQAVNESTVYRWVMSYTEKAIKFFDQYHPKVGTIWVGDETVLNIAGKKVWLYDVIDKETRFLLSARLTVNYGRTTVDAQRVMEDAAKRAGITPKEVITDKQNSYLDGIEQAFGSDTEHILGKPFTRDMSENTNRIERWHGTLKERYKVLRGFKTVETANTILAGIIIDYNFLRPHLALKGKTPAEAAGLNLSIKSWNELVERE